MRKDWSSAARGEDVGEAGGVFKATVGLPVLQDIALPQPQGIAEAARRLVRG